MSLDTFAIITENDESSWDDITGEQYHFPKRYLKYIPEGTKVIYYKGKLRDKGFENQRLTDRPHYFAIAEIDYLKPDLNSEKGDFFAILKGYTEFEEPIFIFNEIENDYFELIPPNLASNYWRNAVRPISKEIYQKITGQVDLPKQTITERKEFETVYTDGEKKVKYSTYYERNRRLRKKAIEIHGLTCKVCNLNFEQTYGDIGKDFIHVHHTKPLAETGKCIIDPEKDLTVVCPNCHSMLHRPAKRVLTVEELREIIKLKTLSH